MKKSIFNLALLSVLVLGACSVDDAGGDTGGGKVTIPGGTGDPVVDAGLKDALTQIGSVEGMDVWSVLQESNDDVAVDFVIQSTYNLYLLEDKFKEIIITVFDGLSASEILFNNEISSKEVSEGTFTPSGDSFKLFDSIGVEITDVDKKGYTTLYVKIPSKASGWGSSKLEESGKWENVPADRLGTSYTIVKKTDTELSMIRVDLKTTGKPEDGYTIYGTMDESIKNARTYTKK